MDSLRRISVSVLFSLFCLPVFCSNPYDQVAGAREAGMGYVCSMRSTFWSSFHNPANLAEAENFSAAVNYLDRFRIDELGTRSAAVVIPSGKTGIGAIYSNFGYKDFMRHMAGIGCGMSLSGKISAGLQVDYFSEHTSGEYENLHSITFEAGVLLYPSENVSIGIRIFNPLPQKLNGSELPSVITAGAGIVLSEGVFAGAETELSTRNRMLVRTGFEYAAFRKFLLRGGFCSENTSFSFGMGYEMSFVQLDLAFTTHEKLGISSSVSLLFRIR
ncbi:MAG TPA: hypothetical protein VK213_05355 [Bacteroidales bacterium]|nr:hypothetical protein [Bacteroidales bacterium]